MHVKPKYIFLQCRTKTKWRQGIGHQDIWFAFSLKNREPKIRGGGLGWGGDNTLREFPYTVLLGSIRN